MGNGTGRIIFRRILTTRIDVTSYEGVSRRVIAWAKAGESRYVCVATVNNVMEAYDSKEFEAVMGTADLVTPDGMPLVWGLRLLGARSATRVYGPELTPVALEAAERNNIPVGFYGASLSTLSRLRKVLRARFPALRIVYEFSPPFRPLTPEEDLEVIQALSCSGAKIVFVGLNTPKQDYWMASHKGKVPAVMIGVGAAFDFIAGTKPQAPRWLMKIGMEWLFRLATEPRRLWRRYLKHNPRFVVLFLRQLIGSEIYAKMRSGL